jgi:hypothetical protein
MVWGVGKLEAKNWQIKGVPLCSAGHVEGF